jgi:hypothetical protein
VPGGGWGAEVARSFYEADARLIVWMKELIPGIKRLFSWPAQETQGNSRCWGHPFAAPATALMGPGDILIRKSAQARPPSSGPRSDL